MPNKQVAERFKENGRKVCAFDEDNVGETDQDVKKIEEKILGTRGDGIAQAGESFERSLAISEGSSMAGSSDPTFREQPSEPKKKGKAKEKKKGGGSTKKKKKKKKKKKNRK